MQTKAKPQTLLNIDQNPKTIKNQKYNYLTAILYLAPANLASTPELKINVCSMAELAKCKEPCLNTAGRGQFTATQKARIRKTKWFFEDRAGFMAQLFKEIEALERKAKKLNLKPAVRLNGTSDIQWENVRVEIEQSKDNTNQTNATTQTKTRTTIFELFPEVQFYDYTKIPNRGTEDNPLPANYHLTFSYSNHNQFTKYNEQAIKRGMSIAVVFESKARVQDYVRSGAKFKGMPVIDGDETDARFLDGKGVVVGLYAKGKAKKDYSGFVIRS